MLNIDSYRRLVMYTAEMNWDEDAAAPGVWRKPLDSSDAGSDYTISLVRFDAETRFLQHHHSEGEEILVLHGEVSDEFGDYTAGHYLRYPSGSSHTPFTTDGCEMLVVRHQFGADDRQAISIDTNALQWLPAEGDMEMMPLFDDAAESVILLKLPAGCHRVRRPNFGGVEWFVIAGCLYDDEGVYPAGSWVRYPDDSIDSMVADEDSIVWCKRGHLSSAW